VNVGAMELTLLCKSDYPVGEAVIKIKSTASLNELRAKAVESLNVQDKKSYDQYGMFTVAYLQNVINLLDREAKGEGKTLADLGVKDRSALFLRAPVDLKPPVRLAKKESSR